MKQFAEGILFYIFLLSITGLTLKGGLLLVKLLSKVDVVVTAQPGDSTSPHEPTAAERAHGATIK